MLVLLFLFLLLLQLLLLLMLPRERSHASRHVPSACSSPALDPYKTTAHLPAALVFWQHGTHTVGHKVPGFAASAA